MTSTPSAAAAMLLRLAQQTNEMAADVRDAELKDIKLEAVARYEKLAQLAIASAEPTFNLTGRPRLRTLRET